MRCERRASTPRLVGGRRIASRPAPRSSSSIPPARTRSWSRPGPTSSLDCRRGQRRVRRACSAPAMCWSRQAGDPASTCSVAAVEAAAESGAARRTQPRAVPAGARGGAGAVRPAGGQRVRGDRTCSVRHASDGSRDCAAAGRASTVGRRDAGSRRGGGGARRPGRGRPGGAGPRRSTRPEPATRSPAYSLPPWPRAGCCSTPPGSASRPAPTPSSAPAPKSPTPLAATSPSTARGDTYAADSCDGSPWSGPRGQARDALFVAADRDSSARHSWLLAVENLTTRLKGLICSCSTRSVGMQFDLHDGRLATASTAQRCLT